MRCLLENRNVSFSLAVYGFLYHKAADSHMKKDLAAESSAMSLLFLIQT